VETEDQLKLLRDENCDQIQGYYFSRPVPAAEFGAMLRDGKRLALDDDPDLLPPTVVSLAHKAVPAAAHATVVR
jgi:hypothetical protein